MKKLLLVVMAIAPAAAFAQVGIGNTSPQSQLDISASNPTAPTSQDGLLIPRIDAFPAIAPTANQNGMMVFLTTTSAGKVPGFYYWDQPSTSWKGVGTNTANAWNLTGNTGYNAGTSFIGSIDSKEVFFRHTNQPSGVIGFADTSFGYRSLGAYSLTARNSAFGTLALENNTVSTENSVLGSEALNANTAGSKNVAVGNRALYKQAFSNAGVAFDTRNVAVGFGAMYATNATNNSNGSGNVGVGYYALSNNGTGLSNIGIGQYALGASASGGGSMTGNWNIGIGGTALKSNVAGSGNIAMGSASLGYNSNGTDNIGIGTNALFYSTNLSNGTAVGTRAMENYGIFVTGTNDNVAFGYEALRGTSTGAVYTKNAAVGYQSMAANVSGDGNAAMGYQSLAGNTSGANNTAIGHTASGGNTTGSDNVAIGNAALINNKAGSKAVAIGSGAMENANNTATAFDSKNIAIGFDALKGSAAPASNTGVNNIAIGSDALKATTSGEKNTALGNSALVQNITGTDNIGVGIYNLQSNTNGMNNTSIGNYALEYGNASNNTAVGYYALNHIGGNNNTAVGHLSMAGTTMGAGNTSLGAYSLSNVSGTYNTALGFSAGDGNTIGNYNITIGANSDALNPAADNQMSIANVIYGANMDNLATTPANLAIGAAPNAKYRLYNYTNQVTANGIGQYGIYTYRTRNSANDGTGYGAGNTNAAIAGYNYWGDMYTFGTIGYSYFDFTRCGGILGSHATGSIWSSLAYRASSGTGYAVYATATPFTGAGRQSQQETDSSIGGGFYGSIIGSWSKGDIGNVSSGNLFAAYNIGDEYTAGRQIELVDTGNSKTVAYTMTSTESVVYKKGKITLVNGSARVSFDANYVGLLGDVPIVTTTPMGPCNGIYIESVDKTGFTVKELNNGASNIAISWIAVGDRIDVGHAANSDVLAKDFDTNLNEVMFNENNKTESAKGIWSQNGKIQFGTIRQTQPEAGQKQ